MRSCDISPFALVHPKAQLGKRVAVGAGTVIGEGTIIEDDVSIGANCVIGGPPEHREHWGDFKFRVHIEKKAVISNIVTVDCGTERFTTIGEGSILLAHAHIGHDAVVSKGCLVSCHVSIGGFVYLMEGVNVGLSAVIHQRKIIPPFAMIGANTFVGKHSVLRSYFIYVGNPSRELGENLIHKATSHQMIRRNKDYHKLLGKLNDHF